MNIETFPATAPKPVHRVVRDEPRFERIGAAWELRLVAEAYDLLAPGRLLVSDGLAFLVDRLLHSADIDRFVALLDEGSDHSDVYLADFLLDDLRDGCEVLVDAVFEDQRSTHPRILESAADLVIGACRRIRLQA